MSDSLKLYRPVKGERNKDRRLTQKRGEDFIITSGKNKGKWMYKDIVWRPYHLWLDYAGPKSWDKIPVYAAHMWIARVYKTDSWFGNYVTITSRINGVEHITYYGHLDSITAATGEFVTQNQQIGIMGTSGNSTAVHLHFGLKIEGKRSDPTPYITDRDHTPSKPAPVTHPIPEDISFKFASYPAEDIKMLMFLVENKIRNGALGDLNPRSMLLLAKAVNFIMLQIEKNAQKS